MLVEAGTEMSELFAARFSFPRFLFPPMFRIFGLIRLCGVPFSFTSTLLLIRSESVEALKGDAHQENTRGSYILLLALILLLVLRRICAFF
jgi:hypothetical protein